MADDKEKKDSVASEETKESEVKNIASSPLEKEISYCLEDLVFDYEEIIHIPKHASNLINEYLNNARPAKRSSKREVYDNLENAIMNHLENQGEESIVLVHNSNSDHSLYSNDETLSKQFNRILYKKLDEENGFDKDEKARRLSKLVQDYMAYTAENGGFNPVDFVKVAKKTNVYIQRNVKNYLLEDRFKLRVGLQDDRIAFYANKNIGGKSQNMMAKNSKISEFNAEIGGALEKIAVKHNYSLKDDEKSYYPEEKRKRFFERVGTAIKFAKLGYQGAYDRINNVVLAVDKKSKELSHRKTIWPIRETQYTHIGL